ncbi:MAG: F0F1 ATP synthase subunit A [Oscillospiraceae bacterium]|nr:F0F1 ATP synthase subunit A [Oscillospiraceae bacterium]
MGVLQETVFEILHNSENVADMIGEKMAVNEAFHFTIGNMRIAVDDGIFVSWIVIVVLAVLAFCLTRNLKVTNISKRQAAVEFVVTKLEGIFYNTLGEHGKEYVPYLTTVLLFLGLSNIMAVFGFKPPTRDLNVTIALAVMSIVLVQAASIRRHNVFGWIKQFAQPTPVVTVFNILDIFTRPLSLCMRLFGNILGAFVIMGLLEHILPIFLPAVFCLYFDFFDGLLQAYIFTFLTGIYIHEAIEDPEPKEKKVKKKKKKAVAAETAAVEA